MCNDYWHYKSFGFKTRKSFRQALKNPDYNAKVASIIYKNSGWNAWAVVKNGIVKIR